MLKSNNPGSLLKSVKVGKNCKAGFLGGLASLSDGGWDTFFIEFDKDSRDVSNSLSYTQAKVINLDTITCV